MKKIILAFCFFFISGLLLAQKVDLGIKGGLNLSKFDQSYLPDQKFRAGINAGLFAQISLGKIKLQPEILYSQQGCTIDFNYYNPSGNVIGNGEMTFKLNYLNVPIIAKLDLGKRFNFQFGPQAGFILKASSQESPSAIGFPNHDLTSRIKTDFSCSFGLGYEFPFGLMLDGRYNLGLNETGVGSSKNRVMQFSVGYKIFKI